jgi:putative ABC transport system permease protein
MLAFALQNLLSRPVRSVLAWLGLTVAIAGMVGLFSVSAGLQDLLNRTFRGIPGLVAMQPGAPIPIVSRIPAAWGDEIAAMPGVRTVHSEYWARAHLVEGKPTISPPRLLFGVGIASVLRLERAVYRDDLIAGRFLTLDDRGQLSAVVSRSIANEYHKQLGDSLRVDGFDLIIVGIYETGSILADMAILVDSDVVRQIAPQEKSIVSNFYIEPDGSVPRDELAVQIRERFRGRKAAEIVGAGNPLADIATSIVSALAKPPKSVDDSTSSDDEGLLVQSATEMSQQIQKFSGDFDILLMVINTIGVVVALLSILNTMLMSVSERLVEFGVLRANGWSRVNVIYLIVAESAVLGFAGGMSGCLAGWLGTLAVNGWFPSRAHLFASPTVLTCSLIYSVALGMLGGLYPAWWAVKRSPMEAIRRG